MDIVWNESMAEQIRAECERFMTRQADDMRDTLEAYLRMVEHLERLAAEQEYISVTAMMCISWTDGKGNTHSKMVPDNEARAHAAHLAYDYRNQARLLRGAADNLRNAVSDLEDAINSTNAYFSQAQERIQGTDLEYARMIFQTKDDIMGYIAEMKAVHDSFDDSFLIPPVTGTLIKWGPMSKIMGMALRAGILAGNIKSCAFGGDPVNLSTGNFVYSWTDLEVPGRFPLFFKRFYNSSGGPDSVLGPGWTHNYNIRLHAEDGEAYITFGDGHVENYTEIQEGLYAAPLGRHAVLIKTEKCYALTFSLTKLQYIFSLEGAILGIADQNKNRTKFSYNKNGFLAEVSNDSGRLAFSYDLAGLINAVSDDSGRRAVFEYSGGRLAKAIQPSGAVYLYGYDKEGRLDKLTDVEGINTLDNKYDEHGRIARQCFLDGGMMSYDYDNELKTTGFTQQNGCRLIYERDGKYRTTGVVYPDGRESKVFDDKDQILEITNKNGFTSKFEYDKFGHLIKTVDPLGYETLFSYDKNNLTGFTRENRLLSSCLYDKAGNMISSKDPLGNETRIEYGQKGLPVKVIDPAGGITMLKYDARGNMVAITDAAGAVTSFQYNELNQVVKVTMPEGNSMSFCYDAAGNISRVTNAEGNSRYYSYNKNGKVVKFVDFDGGTVRYEYKNASHYRKNYRRYHNNHDHASIPS